MLTRLSGLVRFGRTARELKVDESLITGVQPDLVVFLSPVMVLFNQSTGEGW